MSNTAYTRRQELTCTVADLGTYGNKILLDKEILYVKQVDGRYAIKIGDGVSTIASLPYVVNYSEIDALRGAADSAKTIATEQATIATNKTTEVSTTAETKKTEIETLTTTKKGEIETLATTKKSEITSLTTDKKTEITNLATEKKDAITTEGTRVLGTIPADYTSTTKDVANLKALGLYIDSDGDISQL